MFPIRSVPTCIDIMGQGDKGLHNYLPNKGGAGEGAHGSGADSACSRPWDPVPESQESKRELCAVRLMSPPLSGGECTFRTA